MSRRLVVRAPTKRFSLSVYISLLLVAVAIIPLLVTVGGIEAFLRPSLVSQISADMERDAQTHVQLIDTYLAERLNDVETLSESDAIRNVLAGKLNSKTAASNTLFTALHRDIADYISLSLLDFQGNIVLSYPTAPTLHGNYRIVPNLIPQIRTSEKVFVSDVFYDPLANNPSVDLYVRVVNNNLQPTGIIRASLSLHRLWQPVDGTPQQEGANSYAFVLDQHGVRIAYTNPDHSGFTHPRYLFQAVENLPADFQQRIKDENLYGNNTNAITTMADNRLATIQSNAQSPSIFQFDPAGKGETFEAAKYSSTVVPWTYFVLKPLNTVTGLADQQLLSIFGIVSVMILLALVIGVQVGRRITSPIIRSVTSLRKNSLSLKTLADEEQVVATEQSWMVEASQVALQSIRYYTNAASIAAQRLADLSTDLTRQPNNFNDFRLNKSLKDMAEAAKYVDLAIKHQESANEKLAAALRVTTRAMEQLTSGAKSTDDAAAQLEVIVRQLTEVVGAQDRSFSSNDRPVELINVFTNIRRDIHCPDVKEYYSMSNLYSRRSAIKLGLGTLASASALGLAACNSPASPSVSSSVSMHLFFWGAATRDKLTQKAINFFHDQHPDTMITSSYTTFNNFWPKIDADIVSRKTPELFQMDMRYLAKYVRSGLMLDMSQLIYDQTIDLSDFDPLMLDGSKANNSIYGIPLGGNYECLIYDTVLLENSGVGALPDPLTWESFAQYLNAITHAFGKKVYGSADPSGDISVFEIWVRQRGKELYTVDGQMAFDVQDVEDWFNYWSNLRNSGGCVPANIQAAASGASGPANSSLVHGLSIFALTHSNEFEAYQALTKRKLDFLPMPLGAGPGLYFKPSQLISISATTPFVTQAANFINFIINDPNGIKSIGIERGIPGALKAQTLLRPKFTPAQLQEFTFTNTISNSDMVRVKEVLDPPSASQVASIFGDKAGEISFKRSSISAGAQAFFSAAQKALSAKV